MRETLKYIHQLTGYGLAGIFLIILFLIIQDPSRAQQLKEVFLAPLFRTFRFFSRQYIATKVGRETTNFIKRHISPLIGEGNEIDVRIKWVESPSDPVLRKDGTLILRLEETRDQTKNILSATRVALPKVVCPAVRRHIDDYAEKAIDIAVLKKMADSLGKHAFHSFNHSFYIPEIASDDRSMSLFQQLVELDSHGYFVAIYLDQLAVLGMDLYAAGSQENVTGEIHRFLEYLLQIARRNLNEEVQLNFVSRRIRVGIVLVAKSRRAQLEGVTPYVSRVGRDVAAGCDSVYLVAFAPALDFIDRVSQVIDGNPAYSVIRSQVIRTNSKGGRRGDKIKIVTINATEVALNMEFKERVQSLGIQPGMRFEGRVIDVAEECATVDIMGLEGYLIKEESSWKLTKSCGDVLAQDDLRTFKVLSVDGQKGRISITAKMDDDDPWREIEVPSQGTVIEVDTADVIDDYLVAYEERLGQILIPIRELEWCPPELIDPENFIDKKIKCVLTEIDSERHRLICSVRELVDNPWASMHEKLKKGVPLHGVVKKVSENGCVIQLEGGLTGVLPAEALRKAGHEYHDYENNVVVGQGMDLVVSKVFISRQRLRLDLARNVEN